MAKKTDIDHLAKLANLPLTPQEKSEFELELPEILSYVDQIQELDILDVPETSQVTNKKNEFREDVVEPSLSQKEALSQAKRSHNGYFVTSAVISQENAS